MLHASTQQLIRKLCELTGEGAIAWKEGADGRSTFETEGYVVEIAAEPPLVRLLRLDGRELERADAPDLALAWPGGEGTYAEHVAEMARTASRHARGAETAIAKILSSLSAPPKKAVEPDPEPAALAFADFPQSPDERGPAERAVALAAVNADLNARKPADAQVASRTPPATPVEVPAETETAIDRVLAIQPAAQPAPVIFEAEPAPAAETVEAEAEPEPERDIEPASTIPPILLDEPDEIAAPDAAPAVAADPHPEEPAPSFAAQEPVARLAPPAPATASAPAPAPADMTGEAAQATAQAQPRETPKSGFGAIDGFVRAGRPERPSAPPMEAAKVTSTGLLIRGFSARTVQTVEQATARDIFRPAPGAAAAAPAPAVEKPRRPEVTGADIYKPWA